MKTFAKGATLGASAVAVIYGAFVVREAWKMTQPPPSTAERQSGINVRATQHPGNWHAAVTTCGCGHCRGEWNLGITDFSHPNALRMLGWKLVGRRATERRVDAWNKHVAWLEERKTNNYPPDEVPDGQADGPGPVPDE